MPKSQIAKKPPKCQKITQQINGLNIWANIWAITLKMPMSQNAKKRPEVVSVTDEGISLNSQLHYWEHSWQ
jgi:hypothetical protein